MRRGRRVSAEPSPPSAPTLHAPQPSPLLTLGRGNKEEVGVEGKRDGERAVVAEAELNQSENYSHNRTRVHGSFPAIQTFTPHLSQASATLTGGATVVSSRTSASQGSTTWLTRRTSAFHRPSSPRALMAT